MKYKAYLAIKMYGGKLRSDFAPTFSVRIVIYFLRCHFREPPLKTMLPMQKCMEQDERARGIFAATQIHVYSDKVNFFLRIL